LKTKHKDTDYLFLSTRLRALERNFLTQARIERMLQAATAEESAQVLAEIEYPPFDVNSESSINAALAREREKLFSELSGHLPDPEILDVFRVKYDYHNIKTVIKAGGADVTGLLLDAGRVSPREMTAKFEQRGKWDFLPPVMAEAAEEATRVLHETGDPQRSDFVLDRAYFAEMSDLARAGGSPFLMRYVATLIDAANLRSVVRTERMHRSGAFLQQVLFPGGQISPERVLSGIGNGVAELYRPTPLAEAALLGEDVIAGGSLTEFERACDNAVLARAAEARRVPFGVEVVIGYIVTKENDIAAARIILSGRAAGIAPDIIRERLRDCYV
jgi:V/A-type H+-transporting ATPase subunit C